MLLAIQHVVKIVQLQLLHQLDVFAVEVSQLLSRLPVAGEYVVVGRQVPESPGACIPG